MDIKEIIQNIDFDTTGDELKDAVKTEEKMKELLIEYYIHDLTQNEGMDSEENNDGNAAEQREHITYFDNLGNEGIDNEGIDNEGIDNEGNNNNSITNNSITNNSITNNSINKEIKDDDDDIKREVEKIVTTKIKKKLKNAGINNLTDTKLLPIARSIQKLVSIQQRTPEEAEEIILMAIETYELNNGRSLLYITTILTDWYEKGLHTIQEIRKYIKKLGNNRSDNLEVPSAPVPMINFISEMNNQS